MRFKKRILRPGKYLAQTPSGERKEEEITPSRIQHWAGQFGQMLQAGLRIPAPFLHDNSSPLAKNQPGSKANAGFWDKMWVGKDGCLYGEVEVPREEDASKVGTSILEVSPLIKPTFTDGVGKNWEDTIHHIALVTHPVVPGQANFEKVDKSQPAIALSLSDAIYTPPDVLLAEAAGSEPADTNPGVNASAAGENASAASVKDALAALRAVGLDLPDDTTGDNLVERIVVASRAKAYKPEEEGGPEGDETQQIKAEPSPIAMSTGTANGGNQMSIVETADQVILTGEDLAEYRAFKADRAKAKAAKEAKVKAAGDVLDSADKATAFATELASESLKGRRETLIRSGRITPAYAKKHLDPMIDGFQLAFGEDGKPVASNLDSLLLSLESLPENATGLLQGKTGTRKLTRGKRAGMQLAQEEQLPEGYEGAEEMTDKDVTDVASVQMSNSGLAVPAGA